MTGRRRHRLHCPCDPCRMARRRATDSMKVKIVVEYDDATQRIGFDTQTDCNEKLSRLECALVLGRVIPALIRDGITEQGGRLIVAPNGNMGGPTFRNPS